MRVCVCVCSCACKLLLMWCNCLHVSHYFLRSLCVLYFVKCAFIYIMKRWFWARFSSSAFQTNLSGCASTPGPAAAPVRWRTATWQLFAARRSRRCDPTALNWSTWLLGTPRPIKVRERSELRFYGGRFWCLVLHLSHFQTFPTLLLPCHTADTQGKRKRSNQSAPVDIWTITPRL